jgi:hypothetical protein
VYRGTWRNLPVAVKTVVFQDTACGGEKAQKRAITEAAITSSVSHPNVVATLSYDLQPLQHGASMQTGNFNVHDPSGVGQVTDWCAGGDDGRARARRAGWRLCYAAAALPHPRRRRPRAPRLTPCAASASRPAGSCFSCRSSATAGRCGRRSTGAASTLMRSAACRAW